VSLRYHRWGPATGSRDVKTCKRCDVSVYRKSALIIVSYMATDRRGNPLKPQETTCVPLCARRCGCDCGCWNIIVEEREMCMVCDELEHDTGRLMPKGRK